jgi:hypothetical protein
MTEENYFFLKAQLTTSLSTLSSEDRRRFGCNNYWVWAMSKREIIPTYHCIQKLKGRDAPFVCICFMICEVTWFTKPTAFM